MSIEYKKFNLIMVVLELLVASAVILFDLFIPTLVILVIIFLSLLLRKEKLSALGFKKGITLKKAAEIFLLVVLWSLLLLAVIMPVLNYLTGTKQDLSSFSDLKGNLGKLSFLLSMTWTLAAFGEEMVYRGYLQNRIKELFKNNNFSILISVIISSLLFGIAHTEQGLIGVILTTMDAVFFSIVKIKYENNLWASILAHGFSNTIGLTFFFFTGPIYGFW